MVASLTACGGGGGQSGSSPSSGTAPATPAAVPAAPTAVPATPTPVPVPPAPVPVPVSAARIATVELAQSLLFPSGDSALVLVAGKDALVKVNVTTTNTAQPIPDGTLRVETQAGVLVRTIALTKPTSTLPASVPTVPSFTNAYTAVVPANLVTAGLRLTASIPDGASTVTINPRVGAGVTMDLVAVPVKIGDTVGQVVANPSGFLLARMPFANINFQTRATYTSTSVTTLPTTDADWYTAFTKIANEIIALRLLDNTGKKTYYYGFAPKRSWGFAGLGQIPGNVAVGFDMPSSDWAVLTIMAHELGHNLGLPHAPCAAGNPDPNYPYANGALGAGNRFIWGYNSATKTFVDPTVPNRSDVMGYCNGDTFSDYNYRKIQTYLTPADAFVKTAAASVTAAGPQELLLISGMVSSGKVDMRPVKTLKGEAQLPDDGPYTLRLGTSAGVVEYRFAMQELDHDSSTQLFGFTVPNPGTLLSITILKDGVTLMQRGGVATAQKSVASYVMAADKTSVQWTEQGRTATLRWDNASTPYLTVVHVGAQRTTLAQDLTGGSATVNLPANVPAGGSFEFILSDGLNSHRVTVAR
ncbi:M66 family metalloprotease [Rhodoferax aquaticus]|uniref:M66 family metalloprotease n=1 Tax=Rhodoferax aquaticus TaxID=2527691 RepID=UPI00143E0D27|nr:M66 family metalloprotease [Rhodoferax aquaticus]